jgi:hypothetical protein
MHSLRLAPFTPPGSRETVFSTLLRVPSVHRSSSGGAGGGVGVGNSVSSGSLAAVGNGNGNGSGNVASAPGNAAGASSKPPAKPRAPLPPPPTPPSPPSLSRPPRGRAALLSTTPELFQPPSPSQSQSRSRSRSPSAAPSSASSLAGSDADHSQSGRSLTFSHTDPNTGDGDYYDDNTITQSVSDSARPAARQMPLSHLFDLLPEHQDTESVNSFAGLADATALPAACLPFPSLPLPPSLHWPFAIAALCCPTKCHADDRSLPLYQRRLGGTDIDQVRFFLHFQNFFLFIIISLFFFYSSLPGAVPVGAQPAPAAGRGGHGYRPPLPLPQRRSSR